MSTLRCIARSLIVSRVISTRLISSGDSRHTKIYTRTGDKGTSATYTGQRRRKDDAVFEALGATDELNSHIGYVRSVLHHPEVGEQLKWVQCLLQDLQASIATPKSSASEGQRVKTEFPAEHIKELEQWIDSHSENLPPLKNFILPSGSPAGAALHIARSVCRRAERRVTTLFLENEVDEVVMKYINRLSDYLFVAARICSHHENAEETIYK
ncbi:corrinoid adenosyltransferase MMAB-like isoform X1 [Dermacentor andersoni]|uniref:corrinoid adenosyltransferase MMAB-like isoform X1 n=1 Tax=Dermacentor andersoni TaxID=34620 RepID=UPI00215579B6|nr:corrinoid adenosyltransferase MMAB-like isoform X1 [Dermacentor andersoni]